jgi:cobyrinic acid a,c-diamide synthase
MSVCITAPRLVVGGLCGDAGKTQVTLGLVRALARRGHAVAPYKKGPDYIDTAWLGRAAGRPGRNLDTFLMPDARLGAALLRAGRDAVIVVEGNRGLFDGMDERGTHSTAELAKRIGAPLLLVVDVRKATRTVAAVVAGCQAFDRDLRIAGVVLNRVATARQERLVRHAVEQAAGIPVVGALPVLPGEGLPARHLGLLTADEHPHREEAIERAAAAVEAHVDLGAVLAIAGTAPAAEFRSARKAQRGTPVRIGVVRDEAFSFYYPENLEALEERGATLLPVSALADQPLPAVDAVYVGGGFPEVHVSHLARARDFFESLRHTVERGVPVYAECGGLMLLARSLTVDGRSHAMAGVLDLDVEQTLRPQGHGYAIGRFDRPTSFFPEGAELRGHEFHYSRVTGGGDSTRTALALAKGDGIARGRDGITKGKVFASYVHVHAASDDAWAEGLMAAARGD